MLLSLRRLARPVSLFLCTAFLIGAERPANNVNPWSRDLLSWDEITSPRVELGAPTAPPPFVPAEYSPYAKPGIGVIDGHLEIETTKGPIRSVLNRVMLVPDTAYTYWLKVRVAQVAQRTQNPTSGRLFLKSLPSWMQPTLDDSLQNTGIIRRAYTGKDGHFRFEKVPYGAYFLVVDLQVTYSYTIPATDSFRGYTVDGRDAYITFRDTRTQVAIADGLFVGTNFAIALSPKHQGDVVEAGDFSVFAHMHSFENYTSPPPSPTLDI